MTNNRQPTREEIQAAAEATFERDWARLQASGLETTETLIRAMAEKAAYEFMNGFEGEQPEQPKGWFRKLFGN